MPPVTYQNQAVTIPQRFWTAETGALVKGYAMCYNDDYGTATVAQQERRSWVENPTQDNAHAFAGVLARSFPARAGGQNVELYIPGSYCDCYLFDAAATRGNMRTFYVANGATVGAVHGTNTKYGRLSTYGFPGKGSAIVLQTVTAAGLVPCYLMDGPQSGMAEYINVAAGSGAITIMDGGYSYVNGALASVANYTFTKGAAATNHLRKAIYQAIVMAANNLVVTFNPVGERLDKTTNLNTITFNAQDEFACLEFFEDRWMTMFLEGATEA